VKVQELTAAVTLQDQEDGDFPVSCTTEGAAEIFKKRKPEGHYCSLTGRHLMDRDEIQGIFQSFERCATLFFT
jgi:hypothetical protein